jgi:hypothetical protein
MAIIDTEAKTLFEVIKANNRRLDDCPKHLFENVPIAFNARATCTMCGGAMDVLKISQYVRGYAAAGGNPEDVFPDWNKPIEGAQ